MDEKQKRVSLEFRVGGASFSPQMLLGLFLVVAGTMLFVDNLGVFPFRASRLIWPVALIVWGVVTVLRTANHAVRIWCGAAILGGVLLILREFGVLYVRGSVLWPLALIATGIVMLMYRLKWQPFENRMSVGASHDSYSSEHVLRDYALFSQVKKRVESRAFEGGQLGATFGGVEIDLRRAEISNENRRAVLETNAIFGGIELRLPEHWRVLVEGNAVFGQFEDKTIPPRPEPGVVSPVLVIRGGLAFGAVVLKN